MRKSLILFLFFTLGRICCAQGTYTAASCKYSDVNAVINGPTHTAVNGDTIKIPACSQTNWTTTLAIPAGITLEGAGQGVTILGDDVTKSASSCTNGSSTGPLICFNAGSANLRATGFTIVGVSVDTGVANGAHIRVLGSSHAIRIDHITIDPGETLGIHINGDIWGLIDHFTWITGDFFIPVRVEHYNWNGFSSWNDLWGDASWAAPLNPGSNQAIYIEDSTFSSTNAYANSSVDCYAGGHIVFRHNTTTNYYIGSHGADSDQRHRGCRWIESYNNTIGFSPTENGVGFIAWQRGGSGVFFNNTITMVGYSNSIMQAHNCRDADAGCGGGPNYTPWGACNGSGTYDQNSTGTGYRCVDQPGSGTSCLLGPDTGGTVTVAACSLNGNVANHWSGNQLEPIYVWNNTLNGSSSNTTNGTTNVSANRDYYTGIARPGYTAYTYPHPLQGTGSTSVSPPSSLQATVQ